ncbi:hypothetical protein [Psychromarinibacter sp. S121]|uniref:hypothetical protein n=1 Tax=Psychromarinibacter sp. S121 TaxID=3415127 RepID=UPI003C7D0DDD
MPLNDPLDESEANSVRFGWIAPALAGCLTLGAGLIYAFGWLGDIWQLVRPTREAASLVPLTAFSFVMLGLALMIHRAGGQRDQVVSNALALTTLALAVANYAAILWGHADGLSFLIPSESRVGDRMSPVTSFGMILAALAVLAVVQRRSLLSLSLAVFGISAGICLIVLTTPDMTGNPLISAMAGLSLYTEIGFVLLFTAIALDS